MRLPTQEIAVTEINGTVQITPEALITTSLTGNVGSAPVTVQGQIQHYRSSRHQGELQLTFSDIPDQIVAPFFPDRFVLVNNGTFSGNAKVAFSPGKKIATSGAVQLRGIQSDPLRFLCPFTIAAGGLHWQGQSGAFTVTQGQWAGVAFTGRGQVSGGTLPRLELSLDFPTLNAREAIAIDALRPAVTKPKKPLIVKANVTCRECTYKTLQATDLRVAVHWHDRQAEMHVPSAQVAGGTVQGEVTF